MENHVPVIKDDGLMLIKQILLLTHAKKVLEIGTAIGYSAIFMSKLVDSVTTVERDENMYNLAISNIKNEGVNNINVIFIVIV